MLPAPILPPSAVRRMVPGKCTLYISKKLPVLLFCTCSTVPLPRTPQPPTNPWCTVCTMLRPGTSPAHSLSPSPGAAENDACETPYGKQTLTIASRDPTSGRRQSLPSCVPRALGAHSTAKIIGTHSKSFRAFTPGGIHALRSECETRRVMLNTFITSRASSPLGGF